MKTEIDNKWEDWRYHGLQTIKELSMGEDHIREAISGLLGSDLDTIFSFMGRIRKIRKKIENKVL